MATKFPAVSAVFATLAVHLPSPTFRRVNVIFCAASTAPALTVNSFEVDATPSISQLESVDNVNEQSEVGEAKASNVNVADSEGSTLLVAGPTTHHCALTKRLAGDPEGASNSFDGSEVSAMATDRVPHLLFGDGMVLQLEDTVKLCARFPPLLNTNVFVEVTTPSILDVVVPEWLDGGPLKVTVHV